MSACRFRLRGASSAEPLAAAALPLGGTEAEVTVLKPVALVAARSSGGSGEGGRGLRQNRASQTQHRAAARPERQAACLSDKRRAMTQACSRHGARQGTLTEGIDLDVCQAHAALQHWGGEDMAGRQAGRQAAVLNTRSTPRLTLGGPCHTADSRWCSLRPPPPITSCPTSLAAPVYTIT